MNAHACTQTCMYTHMDALTHSHMHTHTHTHMHACMHAHVCVHTSMHACTRAAMLACMHACNACMQTHTHTQLSQVFKKVGGYVPPYVSVCSSVLPLNICYYYMYIYPCHCLTHVRFTLNGLCIIHNSMTWQCCWDVPMFIHRITLKYFSVSFLKKK